MLGLALLALVLVALIGACLGKWGPAPLILTIVTLLILVIALGMGTPALHFPS